MSKRIGLPDPIWGGEVSADRMRRLLAELTLQLNSMEARLSALEAAARVEVDITKPPARLGQVAVVAGAVYIATGLAASDWTQVS